MEHIIRKAAREDASRLAEILIFAKRTSYRSIFKNDYVSFNEMQVLSLALDYQKREEMLDNIYVYDDGIVKGMMNWGKSADSNYPESIRLYEFYVDPFFQGNGIGTKMMKTLLSQAEAIGAKNIFLWVLEENLKARRFYELFGFASDKTRKLEEGTDVYILRYFKELNTNK
ncbi:GNAT family N-acetyltransferase [Anaerocolumna sp. MB42-C2]|uniref:GNAT family N-acetyltransferase n=1 Tax=Anaerocolumna sp. MB42-C2 TaxID=3070997 RepID=UPI0027E189E0|nr:GNAT family N-acetyltransferase [Anaerocolumna sp. MB42-C2]WMJ87447.1 GNAT family N-acetyltransferase [Anaerocolumna sp. MB42-C2]